MKPSVMGREEYAVGLELQKIWKQHAFLKQQVVFKHIGSGTNVQWVFVVQAEDDKGNFDSVPPNFSAILNAVNLEMIERPDLLNPPVTAGVWEKTTVSCRVQGADRKLVVMSFPAYAQHLVEVQNVPYQYCRYSLNCRIQRAKRRRREKKMSIKEKRRARKYMALQTLNFPNLG